MFDEARALPDGARWFKDSWEALYGRSPLLDLAEATQEAGDSTQARALLDEAERWLSDVRRDGMDSAGLDFLAARLHAARGDRDRALEALGAAVRRGHPQAWALRRDRSFAALRKANPERFLSGF